MKLKNIIIMLILTVICAASAIGEISAKYNKNGIISQDYFWINATALKFPNTARINNDIYINGGTGEDIQNALNEVNGKGWVILSNGTFTNVNISLKSNYKLRGSGMSSTTLQCAAGPYSCFEKNESIARLYFVELEDFKILGTNESGSTGLNFSGISFSKFSDISTELFDFGMSCSDKCWYNDFYHVRSNNNNYNYFLIDIANENRFFGGYSTRAYISHLVITNSNSISFYGYSWEGPNAGLYVGGNQNSFIGNRFELLGDSNITFGGTGRHTISGGYMTGVKIVYEELPEPMNTYFGLQGSKIIGNKNNTAAGLIINQTGSGMTNDYPALWVWSNYTPSGDPTGIRIDIPRTSGNLITANSAKISRFTIDGYGQIWTRRSIEVTLPIKVNATQGYTGSCGAATTLTVSGGVITGCS